MEFKSNKPSISPSRSENLAGFQGNQPRDASDVTKEETYKILFDFSKLSEEISGIESETIGNKIEDVRSRMSQITAMYPHVLKVIRNSPLESKEIDISLLTSLLSIIDFSVKDKLLQIMEQMIGAAGELAWVCLKHLDFVETIGEIFTNNVSIPEALKAIGHSEAHPVICGIDTLWVYRGVLDDEELNVCEDIQKQVKSATSLALNIIFTGTPKILSLTRKLKDIINDSDKYGSTLHDLFQTLLDILHILNDNMYGDLAALIIANSEELVKDLTKLSNRSGDRSGSFRITAERILLKVSRIIILGNISVPTETRSSLEKYISNLDLLRFVNRGQKKFSVSIQFILELLDQHNQIAYLSSLNVSNYLLISLHNVSSLLNDKTKLYSYYNGVRPNISMSTAILSLNYILSMNLLTMFEDSNIPQAVLDNFKHLNLPPLPRPSSIFETLDVGGIFGVDLELVNNEKNFQKLTKSMVFCLHIVLHTFKDELEILQYMNLSSPSNLNKKLVFKVVDLTISSLFTNFLFISKTKHFQNIDLGIILALSQELLFQLVTLELDSIDKSLIWVSLLNMANDICYSDISHAQIFNDMFEFLIQHDTSILNNSLVKSGLQLFLSTFDNGQLKFDKLKSLVADDKSASSSYHDIFVDEYYHLYSDKDMSSRSYISVRGGTDHSSSKDLLYSDQDLMENMSTPIRVHCANNSSRQQSVHVDLYGKA